MLTSVSIPRTLSAASIKVFQCHYIWYRIRYQRIERTPQLAQNVDYKSDIKQKEGFFVSKKSSKGRRFQQVEIGQIGEVRAVVEAVPEAMSAFAGVPMIAAVERKVSLIAELCKRVKDGRAKHLVDHKARDIVLQRVCQVAAGYADANDADWLRTDAAILCALGRDPVSGEPGCSQETTSRFESKAIDKENVELIKDLFIDHFIAEHRKRRPVWGKYWRRKKKKRITLDIDGTMIKTYGTQEGAIYRGGKYKHDMYYPSLIFVGNWLVAANLRMGCEAESKTVVVQLEMIVPKLRKEWPGVEICVRLDAAFGSPQLYSWCRKNHVDYEVGLKETSVLELYSRWFKSAAEEEFRKEFGEPRYLGKDGAEKAQAEHDRIRKIVEPAERMAAEREWRQRRARVVGDFSYRAEKWSNWERILVRVDYTDRGFDIRYVMVSWQYGWPRQIYEDDYCRRGLMEQFIGHFKQTGQRLSAQTFYANQFRMIIYGIAYTLLMHLREIVGGGIALSDIHTMRKTLIVMPMVVQRSKKKIVLQVSEDSAHCRAFLAAWRRLSAA